MQNEPNPNDRIQDTEVRMQKKIENEPNLTAEYRNQKTEDG
jgi:hypothetical protein